MTWTPPYDTDGQVTTDFGGGSDVDYSVAIQSDGKIVVAGYFAGTITSDFALARYNADGSLDTSFGTGGKVATDFGGADSVYSLAVQGDGRIVAAGYSNAGGTQDFALARYMAAEPAPTPTPTPTLVPGVGWPGLVLLASVLAAVGWLIAARRARAGRPG